MLTPSSGPMTYFPAGPGFTPTRLGGDGAQAAVASPTAEINRAIRQLPHRETNAALIISHKSAVGTPQALARATPSRPRNGPFIPTAPALANPPLPNFLSWSIPQLRVKPYHQQARATSVFIPELAGVWKREPAGTVNKSLDKEKRFTIASSMSFARNGMGAQVRASIGCVVASDRNNR
jgi:hypothetical protein